MFHRGPTLLRASIGSATPNLYSIRAADESRLRSALRADAADQYYCALVSLLSSLRCVETGFYAWGAVQAYYSYFYSCRSWLANNGVCVFHSGGHANKKSKAYYVRCRVGEVVKPIKGTTHESAVRLFAECGGAVKFGEQPIGSHSPGRWLQSVRESANYRMSRFSDPVPMDCFRLVTSNGVRRSVVEYLEEGNSYLAYDADHAAVALPIVTLKRLSAELKARSNSLMNEEQVSLVMGTSIDRNGPIRPLLVSLV